MKVNDKMRINPEKLTQVLSKMFGKNIINADYQVTKLPSGVCDNVNLITGVAETAMVKLFYTIGVTVRAGGIWARISRI